jgi:hypothetical protein
MSRGRQQLGRGHLASFTVVYDACVLYPASIRDLVVEIART